jgi:outer membrane protein assembly factor BamB
VLLDGSRIYAGCYGYLYCLDAETGSILWENELRGIGFNEVALSRQGSSVQFVTRVEHHNNS